MARRVVADASPLIGLSRIGGLAWLGPLFGTVAVPHTVQAEILVGDFARSEASISEAFSSNILCAEADDAPPLPAEAALLERLDAGEAACLRVALEHHKVVGTPCLILMDDQAGRAAAQTLGFQVAGCAVIIGMARQRGLIAATLPSFRALHAAGFWLAPAVIRTVLKRVGE